MKIVTTEYDSAVLGHKAPYTVLIPDGAVSRSGVNDGNDCGNDGNNCGNDCNNCGGIPYVLIAHGMTDDVRSWLRGTRICSLLENKHFAAVMPFAANSYYTDMVHGDRFWTQITRELPVMLHDEYGFSFRRSDRFVMGNSMGGYGAFKLALTFPETFAAAVSFSGVTDVAYRMCELRTWDSDAVANWGEDFVHTLPGSDDDLYALVRRVEESGAEKPALYQICGTEDYLYGDNLRFRDFMLARRGCGGWQYEYREAPGAHWWDFWDRELPSVLDLFEGML